MQKNNQLTKPSSPPPKLKVIQKRSFLFADKSKKNPPARMGLLLKLLYYYYGMCINKAWPSFSLEDRHRRDRRTPRIALRPYTKSPFLCISLRVKCIPPVAGALWACNWYLYLEWEQQQNKSSTCNDFNRRMWLKRERGRGRCKWMSSWLSPVLVYGMNK